MKYLLLFIMLTTVSCCPKLVPVSYEKIIYRDSIIEVLKDTTIYISIEKNVSTNIIPDIDTSFLENEYSMSVAFLKQGQLHHNLKQKGQRKKVEIKYVDKEKIVYRETATEKIVEVNRLTRMQSFLIVLGKSAAFMFLILILFVFYKLYRKFKK